MAIIIRQPAAIAGHELDQLGPVKEPLSFPPSILIGKKFIDEIPGIDSMGIWECSPGRWQRTIVQEEFAHFIKGSARFIPEDGEPLDIHAGDSIWFPENTLGVWEITEDVRKVYVVIARPTAWTRFKSALKTVVKRLLRMPADSARMPHAKGVSEEKSALDWRSSEQQLQRS
ncbi:MAG TPA: cupin domain-containing protein [Rhizomicrobium sp.]